MRFSKGLIGRAMLSSIVHQPCEISLHLISSDVFVHPPRPNSELPGHDKTLTGLVEIKSPSERTIQGIKVTLLGHQTLIIPEVMGQTGVMGTRYEEKVMLNKTIEISAETVVTTSGDRGKGKERASDTEFGGNVLSTTSEEQGIHLDKGLHGFEFAFIIPASSAPFERARNGRLRYTLTATALGAGRGRSHISVSREIFIVLQVNSDGGPTPLDIQYHDVHEALGALSVSLTSASLTVGGTANLSIYHPTPPPGLSVHVARVFMEQTIEIYSDLRKGWLKLPVEKLRLWEKGYMPFKDKSKQIDPNLTMDDSLWLRGAEDGVSPGRPGRGISNGFTLAPYGVALNGISGPPTPAIGGNSPLPPFNILLGSTNTSTSTNTSSSGGLTPSHDGYKLKSVMRLPDDNTIRPSTVRGSRAEIRVSHELGVEIFFSRASVLDERETSDSYGKPKVQVFSMRRATIIPSCLATFDTIHLPPYTFESPINSRPASPTHLAPSSLGSNGTKGKEVGGGQQSSAVELEYWKLTQSLRAALPHASGGATPQIGSADRSNPTSQPGSQSASRNSSPTRHHSHGFFGRKSRNTSPHSHGRKSRPPSPTPGNLSSIHQGSLQHNPASPHSIGMNRKGVPSLHALTPAHPLHGQSNSLPTVVTAPASGTTTPKSLVANSPWAVSNLPPRTSSSHNTCQCGRSTEELMDAEHRLLDGAATAPGIFSDAHDEGQLPPPWTPSRPSSPTDEQVTGWISHNAANHANGETARSRQKIGEILDDSSN